MGEAKVGMMIAHVDGAVHVLHHRKADGSGWWLDELSLLGIADNVLASDRWLLLDPDTVRAAFTDRDTISRVQEYIYQQLHYSHPLDETELLEIVGEPVGDPSTQRDYDVRKLQERRDLLESRQLDLICGALIEADIACNENGDRDVFALRQEARKLLARINGEAHAVAKGG